MSKTDEEHLKFINERFKQVLEAFYDLDPNAVPY